MPANTTVGWLAETLGQELAIRLFGADDNLDWVLADGIATVAKRHDLVPGQAPSTTVVMVRWDESVVDVLLLGDSTVIGLTRTGEVVQVRDDRLRQVATDQRTRNVKKGFGSEHRDEWRRIVDAERACRNRPGGYWIAEAAPEAARHAIRARWGRDKLAAILAMTDGVSAGVDRYGVTRDWTAAVKVAREDPGRLVDLVHAAEDDDADGIRWPRSKRHDDKAIAVIDFDRT
jgi:Protein phosphatase 2C